MLQNDFVEALGDMGGCIADYVLMQFESNLDRRLPPVYYSLECIKEYIEDEDGNRTEPPLFKILKGNGIWVDMCPEIVIENLKVVRDEHGKVLKLTPEGIKEWLEKDGPDGEFTWDNNS